jgi:hypothetical protein
MSGANLLAQKASNDFMSPQNESMIDRLVYQDFQRRLGSDLSEKQKTRLLKTVRHYMTQVAEVVPDAPIQVKNKEVLSAVVPDFISYLNRSASVQQPQEDQREQDNTRQDVSTRFSQLQNERNQGKAAPPPPPDFRVPLDSDGPTSLSIYEQIKKQREEETARSEALIQRTVKAETSFQDAKSQSSQMEQMILTTREQSRTNYQQESAAEMASRFVSPDPRRMFMKDLLDGTPMGQSQGQGTSLELIESASGLGTGNPTIVNPDRSRIKQQDVLIRQEDILSYKENEFNLHVYSADRNWFSNTTQNRYNFTVNFDPANNSSGFAFAPTAAIKFKNIVRIELVKTILPIEGVDIIQTRSVVSNVVSYGTSLNTNILSFPYLNIRIPELDNNNYGTDYNLQQAFGVVQYDANWVSDNNISSKGGFLAMIPKFLKCQKVYAPTPLATLQKLSIRIERPDGNLVSDTLDTLDISGIKSSYNMTNCPTSNGVVTGTSYSDTSGNYLWIQTKTWFNRFLINQGDRIQMSGLAFQPSYSGNTAAATDLIEYLTRSQGHLVVGVGYTTSGGSSVYYNDGANIVGYCNYIIIRSKMKDPTLGFTQPDTFGLLANSANNTFLNTLCTANLASGRLINISHQTTLVFRVITRDLDSTARIRPDNL